jgi:type IV pilus assembly protein PilZ
MQGGNKGILAVNIQDAAQLYAQYMPFVVNGGLFVPTAKQYGIGDEVFMPITLFDEPEVMPVAGKVIWITPKGAQGNRQPGIGVQFNGQDDKARQKIETLLAGSLNSDRPTHTM